MTSPLQRTEEERARIAVAEQLRRLTHEFMRTAQAPADLEALAGRIGDEADRLADLDDRVRSVERFRSPELMPSPADGEEFLNSLDRPFSGLGQPVSVPMRVWRHGERAVTDLVLGPAFEGAPGMAHGGIVAGIFDDLLGFLLFKERTMAFTANLKVDYLRGTPVGEPLRFEAWVDRIDGRKLFLAAECRHGDDVLSTCAALFIDVADRLAAALE